MPARCAPLLFGFIPSGLMSGTVSAIATLRNAGWVDDLALRWLGARVLSWVIAFPGVLVVAPLTRRLVGRLVSPRAAS